MDERHTNPWDQRVMAYVQSVKCFRVTFSLRTRQTPQVAAEQLLRLCTEQKPNLGHLPIDRPWDLGDILPREVSYLDVSYGRHRAAPGRAASWRDILDRALALS